MTPSLTLSRIRQLDPLAAIQALSRLDSNEQALRGLTAFLRHTDALVRVEAVRALGGRGVEALGWLVPLLEDAESAVRREAATVLGKFGPTARSAVPALAALLKEDEARVRTAATVALGQIGTSAGAAVPALIGVLKGPHLILSRLAAQALARIGMAAVPALIEALATADAYGRREAAWALGEVGPCLAEGKAIPEVIPEPLPARPAAPTAEQQATVQIFLGDTVPVQPVLNPPGPRPVREPAPDAVTALVNALQDPDVKVRDCAARALGRIREGR